MIVGLLSLGVKGCVAYSSISFLSRAWHNRKNRRPASVLNQSDPSSRIIIVTTAAIPWRTGTAVNPVLRASYLAATTRCKITLVVPYIPVQDQVHVFPASVTCSSPADQTKLIRSWAQEHSQFPAGVADFQILYYQARYYPASRCIFPSEDIIRLLPKDNVSLVLLEEPEHLNWYRSKNRWTSQFDHVVGVLHTHYSGYAADLPGSFINRAAVGLVCRVVCRLHCHRIVQLSEIAKGLARSTVVNVHGVSAKFLRVGQQTAYKLWKYQQQQQVVTIGSNTATVNSTVCFGKGCYFLGKALWDKGHGELMHLLEHHARKHEQVAVDVYGNGPDLAAIRSEAERRGLPLQFRGQADHCGQELQEYKVFINCCKKDVLATATAEAVAMNKWVILPEAPCNQFFKTFPNVLIFNNKSSFSKQLLHALEFDPPPLSDEHLRELSWAAATERLLSAASIHRWPGALSQAWDDCLWVPYRLFALLFRGARQAFAAAPKLLPESEQHIQLQQQQQQQKTCAANGGVDMHGLH